MPAADARGTFHVDPVTMEPASQTSDHSSPERRDLAVPALSGAIPRVTTAYYPDAYRQFSTKGALFRQVDSDIDVSNRCVTTLTHLKELKSCGPADTHDAVAQAPGEEPGLGSDYRPEQHDLQQNELQEPTGNSSSRVLHTSTSAASCMPSATDTSSAVPSLHSLPNRSPGEEKYHSPFVVRPVPHFGTFEPTPMSTGADGLLETGQTPTTPTTMHMSRWGSGARPQISRLARLTCRDRWQHHHYWSCFGSCGSLSRPTSTACAHCSQPPSLH